MCAGRTAGFGIEGVGLLELAQDSIHIATLLEEGFRIPLAAAGGEIVAAVDVNGASEAGNWICDGVDDVMAEGFGVFFAEGAGAGGFELAGGVPGTRRQKMLSSRPV